MKQWKKHIPGFACCFAFTCFLSLPETAPAQARKTVIGRIERVSIPAFGLSLEGRIDTGARKCSLHAFHEKEVRSGGESFIEFSTTDDQGKILRMKSRIVERIMIRTTGGESSHRYVIREKVTLGSVTRDVHINLNNRSGLIYKFLVGRNLLRGTFVVDVSQSHVLAD
jgi:ribosomal protein S6--L-glutamate ligase